MKALGNDLLKKLYLKKIYPALYALVFMSVLLGLSVILEGCTDKCEVTNEYVYYEAVYTELDVIRAGVAVTEPQQIESTGKIYFKDDYLYVSDPGKGIHVIDNRNPSSPVFKKFLKIPGNFDLAIRGNTLYADSYVDLVAFDVSDLSNIREVGRLEGIFTQYRAMTYLNDPNCCVITGFEEKAQISVNESDCEFSNIQPWGGVFYDRGVLVPLTMVESFNSTAAIAPGSGSGSGVGGSMARFTINGNHLYLLDGAEIQTVDVSSEEDPVAVSRKHLGWDIEAIFPYGSHLFIGSRSGMYVLDISNPTDPVNVSVYSHIRSCDPVVVDDQYAYVTLRSGNECAGFTNQLEVIDISDLTSPELVKVYPMTNPHGLGIDDKTLFICDGQDGLKAFNAADVHAIDKNLLAHYKNIDAYDVIPYQDVLMMIGADGIFQYDYSNPQNIRLLSRIDVKNIR